MLNQLEEENQTLRQLQNQIDHLSQQFQDQKLLMKIIDQKNQILQDQNQELINENYELKQIIIDFQIQQKRDPDQYYKQELNQIKSEFSQANQQYNGFITKYIETSQKASISQESPIKTLDNSLNTQLLRQQINNMQQQLDQIVMKEENDFSQTVNIKKSTIQ